MENFGLRRGTAECKAQAERRRANARSIAERLALRVSEAMRTERQNRLIMPVSAVFRLFSGGC
jgi:hypothetical protein